MKLIEGHDVVDGQHFIQTNDCGRGFELGRDALAEADIDLVFIGGGETQAIGL